MKWIKKNPKTKSYIWTAKLLTIGHEFFCSMWEKNALVRLEDGDGTAILANYIPASDPDLTIYEDVNQVLLNENGSQGAKRKLELAHQAVSGDQSFNQEEILTSNECEDNYEAVAVLDPDEVSKTFSNLQEGNFADLKPNCSAIASQVNFFNCQKFGCNLLYID